mmetsp:Transcript_55726/g.63060  ORF Transcript_55726/g.63060 Transcript_55726/m.63060 type:complete len:87 (+) Transcript_55726:237-497(+)
MRTTELYPETMIDTSMREEKRTDGRTTMIDRQKNEGEEEEEEESQTRTTKNSSSIYIYIYLGFIDSFHAADEKKTITPSRCSRKDT